MRLFALKDSADRNAETLAVLACYTAERTYYIDMPQGTDPWTVPFILSSFAARGQWTVGPKWAGRWVESRIVPQSRQNLGEILRENGLDRYDTLRFLEMTGGRNSQDDCYLEPLPVAEAPAWFLERESARVVEVVALEDFRLAVAFRTGEVRLCSIDELEGTCAELTRVSTNEALFARVALQPGGRGICWGSNIAISDELLAKTGIPIPLTWDDLARIAPALLVDAAETAQALDCTRQNINALVKRKSLVPVKSSDKSTLFLRADVLARRDARTPGDASTAHYGAVNL